MRKVKIYLVKLLLSISALTLIWQICQSNLTNLEHFKLLRSNLLKPRGQLGNGPNPMDIINARGFIVELYLIQAKDGAPLSIYHVVNPHANQQTLYRYPVLVGHGITGDSSQLTSNSEHQQARQPVIGQIIALESDTALPFLLANNNFDVYMADARGTSINNHLISTEFRLYGDAPFWNFTLDDQIKYDLPAAVDFVLEQTHEEKLQFVGFSEATSFMFALLSIQPNYHNKLVSFIALAPVCYISHASGAALTVFTLATLIPDYYQGSFIPQPFADSLILRIKQLCQFQLIKNTICLFITSTISGSGDTDPSKGYYSTALKSTSLKSIRHFMQWYIAKRFGMYDHGPIGNLHSYGSIKPPHYDLSKVHLSTIVLFRAINDFLSDVHDQQRLLKELGTKPYLDYELPSFNHLDFVMGRTVVRDVNLPAARAMFEIMKQHANLELLRPTNILRDPNKLSLPRRHQPIIVRKPDGSRFLPVESDFIGNLYEGLAGPGAIFSFAA